MRLRRKATTDAGSDDLEPATDGSRTTSSPDPVTGPFDADDVDLEDDPAFEDHIDLGGILVAPPPEGIEVQLQVDEQSGTVLAVLLAGEEGALELRAFASSRGGDLWTEVRKAIAGETAQHGGTANERSGDFGTELLTQLPVTTPDGQSAIQPTRVIGVTGGRWFLRATLLGRPAVEPEAAGAWEDQIRSVVVRRGTGAMPPGEAIALSMPPGLPSDGG